MGSSLLQRILRETPNLGRAERLVAEIVHAHPDQVIHMSMATLAEKSGVSDPTIIRFCRRFGFEGYQDFKVQLAQSLVPTAPFQYEQITRIDTAESIVRKTCRNALNSVQRALDEVDSAQIETAARLIMASQWTGIYASGISEITALDAEHKLQRLGLRCAVIASRGQQRLQAEFGRLGELAIFFSESGATRHLVELARGIKAGGTKVLSITADDSPLAETSDHVVAVSAYNQTELMTPLGSRLNHYLTVNMIVATIAALNGSNAPDQLPALDSWHTEKL
ncbi:MurR/RpiR family transcriptional regulator [Devosia elaeis]|uniref:Transcriptional regulator n=1 Tax=Devosia elaeis TaxID=1770058 RepID=A0A178HKM3_9HYPH|nr:MurR/RpiR family transcriptional regulator [Devosia elaeis]OAM72970.1 transcriptional regulator [Devosia elaeis]